MTVALSRLNFRDVGGLPTTDGRVLRCGVLYRSEGPANFKAEHRQELAALHIRLICDLRAQAERNSAPNDWSGTARILNLELTNDLRAKPDEGRALLDDPTEAGVRTAMKLNYSAIPGALHPRWPELIDSLIGGEKPVLVHCTAGKDRTGVLVALLLQLIGVPHDEVVADYCRSAVFGKNLRLGGSIPDAFEKMYGFVPSEAVIEAMIGAHPEFLDAALDAVVLKWGSVERYFQTAGITGARLARLRTVLLDG